MTQEYQSRPSATEALVAEESGREAEVMKILGDRKLLRFGANRDGTPRFPRAIPRDIELQEWAYQ